MKSKAQKADNDKKFTAEGRILKSAAVPETHDVIPPSAAHDSRTRLLNAQTKIENIPNPTIVAFIVATILLGFIFQVNFSVGDVKLLPALKPPSKEYISYRDRYVNKLLSDPGYNLHISPITDNSILLLAEGNATSGEAPCPGLNWIRDIDIHRNGPYFYSHLTDYLRFCMLFRHGGVYSDFDAIHLGRWTPTSHVSRVFAAAAGSSGGGIVGALRRGAAVIGHDSASGAKPPRLGDPASATTTTSGGACSWCLRSGNTRDAYLAPGVMAAPRAHELVRRALVIGFERDKYDAQVFNAVGPRAVTRAYQELLEDEQYQTDSNSATSKVIALERNVLYPYSYLNSWEVFKRSPDAASVTGGDGEAAGEAIVRKSMSLHLYGHKTKHLVPEFGSALEYLLRKQKVIKQPNELEQKASADSPMVDAYSFEINGPRSVGISKYIQEIEGVRIVSDVKFGRAKAVPKVLLKLQVEASAGRIRIAGKVPGSEHGEWAAKLITQPISPAHANFLLSRLMYFASDSHEEIDKITVTVTSNSSTSTVSKSVAVYNLPKLVSIMIKTTARMTKVFSLVTSILENYPNMTIIVADDGYTDPARMTKPEGPQRGFYYLPLPYDVGLSAGRNRMVERIRTKYVLTLDDDFILDGSSQIVRLIHALEIPPDDNGPRFEIAAGKIPVDEGRFGIDYCGTMTAVLHGNARGARTLRLDTPSKPPLSHEGCLEVDFVPNVFVARAEFLRNVLRWDETLKLGEHEDFFWRAKTSVVPHARVLTCPGVSFHHDQVEHWKGNTEYDRKRSRVFDFWKLALRKHGFNRLVSFGKIVMDLVLPDEIKKLEASEILSRSIFLTWKSPAASFKVLQSTDEGHSWAPVNHGQGENYEQEPHKVSTEPHGFERHADSENWITIYGLRPGTKYRFRIHAGNRFIFREGGVEIEVWTLSSPQESNMNLLRNPGFESSTVTFYDISPAAKYALVPIIDGSAQMPSSSTNNGLRTEITTVGYLQQERSVASVSQLIAGHRIRAFAESVPCDGGSKMIVSAQSRLDALFDAADGMSWRVNVKIWMSTLGPQKRQCERNEDMWAQALDAAAGAGRNGRRMLEWGPADGETKAEFDRSNGGWQTRTATTCLAEGWAARVRGVEVAGVLETFRGSVTWDDFVAHVASA
ncbi:Beta-1,4 N-acetylgalactosaminyltransferase 1 [Entophlyctis luteolus]|nr:Beta-1,4 N-acetylgalactosaminyltransferase 1 [Entophlyctis luteolus]